MNTPSTPSTPRTSRTKKVLAGGLAGLALTGGTVAFALTTSGAASAQDVAQSSVTQDVGGHGLRSWLREHRREIRREIAQTAADKIGISVEQLRDEFQSGKSLAEIATAHDVDPKVVSDALVAQADARIDQAVTDGKITQERGDAAKAKVPQVVDRIMSFHKGDRANPAGQN